MGRLVLVLLLALAGPLRAENPVLHEERTWRGVVELEAGPAATPPAGVAGERQTERLEFVLMTVPPRKTIGGIRLPFGQRETRGRWTLDIDGRDGEGEDAVRARGAGRGRLHGRVAGWVEPATGRYRIVFSVSPRNLVAMTTLTGRSNGRLATWRAATSRHPLLHGFEIEEGGRPGAPVLEGRRELVDRRLRRPRRVSVHWRVERVDPVVRGRVTDHRGRPLAGLAVIATTTNPARIRRRLAPLRREGETDAQGRFRIDAFRAHWNVEVRGADRGAEVVSGTFVDGGARVTRDEAPRLEVTLEVYRLEALPYAHLLRRHFQGDVKAFLAYVRERVPPWRMKQALAK